MRMKTLALIGVVASLSACASISEDSCYAGTWEELGYKDGLNGRASTRIASYAKECSKYGVLPDRQAYLSAYDQGIIRYCTYERGFARGERGSSYNQACSGPLAAAFAPGYDAGRAVYDIRQEHRSLIASYYDTVDALIETRRKLREDELIPKEVKRLEKKKARLKRRKEDLRIDIRTLERLHGLPRHRFG